MDKVFPFAIKSQKQLYFIFILISLIIALIISLAIFDWTHPYKLHLKYQSPVSVNGFVLYHDFNKYGFSEKVEITNKEEEKKYFLLFVPYSRPDAYKVIDQFNFNEPLNSKWIFFGDYTGDGYDETIVFTQNGDSLYLSVIDINLKKWILKRQYILGVQKPNPHHLWDIGEIFCHLLDVNNDWKPEIVFAIHSGFSQRPRGVFIYDIAAQRIIKRREFDAGIKESLIYDLTGDGKPEIIVAGHATGNIHKKSTYTDFKAWLFVFDRQLNFIFLPKSFGEYPSVVFCQPLEINGAPNLLISYFYAGEMAIPDVLYLMDASGKLIRKKSLNDLDLKLAVVDRAYPEPIIYAYSQYGKIIRLNTKLEVIKKVDLRKKPFNFWEFCDLDSDGKTELVCTTSDEVLALDQNLKTIAAFKFPFKKIEPWPKLFSKKYNGPNAPAELSVTDAKYNYLFSLKKNISFALFPIIFIGIGGLIFFVLLLIHKFMTFLNIYISFFLYSLRKSSQGLMILDGKCRIFYFNVRVQEILHLSEPISKKQHFSKIFINHPSMLECVQKAMEHGKSHKCNLNLQDPSKQFKGELSVTPFVSPFKLVYAYLIEIFDHTQPILSDRLKVWSHSVQKMAHDIKQPLSSISLNLKALQMRLRDIDLASKEEILDDVQMMHSEMEKVRRITNNFLKFVNLETPKFQWIDLNETIRNSITRFNPLLNGDLKIEMEFDSEITSIWADPRQLEIVFHVIIENAIDAMKGKGHIRIDTALVQDFENFNRQLIQITIEDNGPGIKEHVKENLFEPFFTTKQDGTGMGLAIAKKIIEEHGGKIKIHSKEKIGTTVRIIFPQIESSS